MSTMSRYSSSSWFQIQNSNLELFWFLWWSWSCSLVLWFVCVKWKMILQDSRLSTLGPVVSGCQVCTFPLDKKDVPKPTEMKSLENHPFIERKTQEVERNPARHLPCITRWLHSVHSEVDEISRLSPSYSSFLSSHHPHHHNHCRYALNIFPSINIYIALSHKMAPQCCSFRGWQSSKFKISIIPIITILSIIMIRSSPLSQSIFSEHSSDTTEGWNTPK